MDIISRLSKLDIETHNAHSPYDSYEFLTITKMQDEVKRNWLELPSDVMSLIFLKLGAVHILVTAQWVCSSWWKLSKQPHFFCSIHVEECVTQFGGRVMEHSRGIVREAIDRSCGQLLKFSIRAVANDELLHYMSEKSSSLRCFRLVNDDDLVTDNGLIEIAKKLPQLEELEIFHYSRILKDVFETFGCLCPHLKSCGLINLDYYRPGCFESSGVALAIAETMPELCRLNLFAIELTDDDLKAILDGCPHLESLDLWQCFGLRFKGDLEERCLNIKEFRCPNNDILDNDIDDALWLNYYGI